MQISETTGKDIKTVIFIDTMCSNLIITWNTKKQSLQYINDKTTIFKMRNIKEGIYHRLDIMEGYSDKLEDVSVETSKMKIRIQQ